MNLRDGVNRSRLGPSDEPRKMRAITADVHQRTARELCIEADVPINTSGAIAEVRSDQAKLTDRAGLHGRDDLLRLRMRNIHERLDENFPCASGLSEHLFSVRTIYSQRFLAKHVLSGAQRFNRPLVM